MSKPKLSLATNNPFQMGQTPSPSGFNLVNQANPFTSVFDPRPLDITEAKVIDQILEENSILGKLSVEEHRANSDTLKKITSEIKAIGRQGTVLMGERIYKAREILKSYRERAFSKWLLSTFGNRSSGYNALSYYELYQALPDQGLQEAFKKIPQTVAYMLASRSADIEAKKDFIRDYHGVSHSVAAQLIQEKFPVSSTDQRSNKTSCDSLINEMKISIKKLSRKKSSLTDLNIKDVKALKDLLDQILSDVEKPQEAEEVEINISV